MRRYRFAALLLPVLFLLLPAARPARSAEDSAQGPLIRIIIGLPGMRCEACSKAVYTKLKQFPEVVKAEISIKQERVTMWAKPGFEQYVALLHAVEEAGGAIQMFHPKYIEPKAYYAAIGIKNRTPENTQELEDALKKLPGVRTAIIDTDRWFTNEKGIEVGGVVMFADENPRLTLLMKETGSKMGMIVEPADHGHDNIPGKEWSELNHAMAGLFLLLLAIVGIAQTASEKPPTVIKYGTCVLWVLMFAFLFIRSDPEAWPLGQLSWWETWRDWEVAQHRASISLLIPIAIGDFLRIRSGWKLNPMFGRWGILLIGLIGSTILFFHQHQTIDPAHAALMARMNGEHLAMAVSVLLFGVSKFLWDTFKLPRLPNEGGKYVWLGCLAALSIVLLLYVE